MYYFDNARTSLVKPTTTIKEINDYLVNPYSLSSKEGLRLVYKTRKELAKLLNLANPLNIAFTSGATESLNLVINGLFTDTDHIITSILEHNSVLRPLYNIGSELSFLDIDDENNIDLLNFERLVKDNTKALIITHASNLLGNIVDLKKLSELCKLNNILFIVDASQTIGAIEIDINLVDVLIFTAHKSLFSAAGLGGIVVNKELDFKIVKTGGNDNTFLKIQNKVMPDIFEVGTKNDLGIISLNKSLEFINDLKIENIIRKKQDLFNYLFDELTKNENLTIYSKKTNNVGVLAFNLKNKQSSEIADILEEEYQIILRPNGHCAPLVHKKFLTDNQGMLRISLSYFNTIEEVDYLIKSINHLTRSLL